MLVNSSSKGNNDGAGFVAGTKFFKEALSAELMVLSQEYLKILNDCKTNTLAGHTRLASIRYRNAMGYTEEETHPHIFGKNKNYWLMHNGNFKTFLPTANSKLTDSRLFANKLEEILGDDLLNISHIEEALTQAGTCEYSLLIGNSASEDIFVIRGNRPLATVDTNYGILLNTEEEVLKDLWVNLWPLQVFGEEVFKLGIVNPLPEWNAYLLSEGVLSPIKSIESLKEVNGISTVPFVATNTAWEMNMAGTRSILTSTTGTANITPDSTTVGTIFKDHILSLVSSITELVHIKILLSITDEELSKMFSEIFEDISERDWFNYPKPLIGKMIQFLKWLSAKPQFLPDEEKNTVWKMVLDKYGKDAYSIAALCVVGFGCPYFINSKADFSLLTYAVEDESN